MAREANATPHPNITALKKKIVDVRAKYPVKGIMDACSKFRSKVEAVIKAEGSWIEH